MRICTVNRQKSEWTMALTGCHFSALAFRISSILAFLHNQSAADAYFATYSLHFSQKYPVLSEYCGLQDEIWFPLRSVSASPDFPAYGRTADGSR